MNRFGWGLLALFALLGTSFALMVENGSDAPRVEADARQPSRSDGQYAVPVAGIARSALIDTWGQSRAGGARAHEAIDIPAPGGTAVIASFAGTVEKLFTSRDGGLTLYVRSGDGRRMGYYAHLAGYAPGIAEGVRVAREQLLGTVGDTGNAVPGNTHLHFAVHHMRPGEKWYQGTPINPYPLLAGKPTLQ